MSENQNCGAVDFAKYEAMSTEELEEILRLDIETPEGETSDEEVILYVMEVLAERRKNAGHTGKTVLEAYESFKQNYMPATDSTTQKAFVKTKGGTRQWLRNLVATAAVLAFLIAGSVTTEAFGFNIWKTVVQWTQETFHFGQWGTSDSNNSLPYASLQEALEKGNVPASLVPTWMPDGFEMVEISTERSPLKKKYTAIYKNQSKSLTVTVREFLNEDAAYVEQSEGLAEEYTASGITYYLFDNAEYSKVVWLYENYECTISGDVTVEELKQMIDSIQKG